MGGGALAASKAANNFPADALFTGLLVNEHAIVRPSALSRRDVAFFNLNGYVSVAFFAATLADVLFR